MKKLAILCLGALLTGCDYTVPLVTTPEVDLDPSILGLWQRPRQNDDPETLIILPLRPKEYFVSFSSDDTKTMYARGAIWRGAGGSLVQLDWFGAADGSVPDDNETFQYASYALVGNKLHVRLLNSNVVSKEIATSDALARAIADNKDNPALFREEMVFTRIKN